MTWKNHTTKEVDQIRLEEFTVSIIQYTRERWKKKERPARWRKGCSMRRLLDCHTTWFLNVYSRLALYYLFSVRNILNDDCILVVTVTVLILMRE